MFTGGCKFPVPRTISWLSKYAVEHNTRHWWYLKLYYLQMLEKTMYKYMNLLNKQHRKSSMEWFYSVNKCIPVWNTSIFRTNTVIEISIAILFKHL